LTIGGRPKEEGGHKAWNLTLNKETSDILEKIGKHSLNRSEFVEEAVFFLRVEKRKALKRLDRNKDHSLVGEICNSFMRGLWDIILPD
jgi:hypothetical protein